MAERTTDPIRAVGTGESGSDEHEARRWEQPRGVALLWGLVLAGPVAWALHLNAAYFVSAFQCEAWRPAIFLLTAACLGISLAAAWIGERTRSAMHERRTDSETALEARSLFMARGAVWLGLGFALVILAQAIPAILLSPCHGIG
jgi:hypothetical protein